MKDLITIVSGTLIVLCFIASLIYLLITLSFVQLGALLIVIVGFIFIYVFAVIHAIKKSISNCFLGLKQDD